MRQTRVGLVEVILALWLAGMAIGFFVGSLSIYAAAGAAIWAVVAVLWLYEKIRGRRPYGDSIRRR